MRYKSTGLTAERVRELLAYDSETGVFTWKTVRSGQRRQGTRAGRIACNGYRVICIDRHQYYEHRLAWLYVYGTWPPDEIDHKDCDRANNKISNLRAATTRQNQGNKPRQVNNTSGAKGVCWLENAGKWGARVQVKGRFMHIGLFNTVDDAAAAYAKAAREVFGEFARTE